MQVQLGPEAEDFFQSLSEPPETSILLNRKKPSNIESEKVTWNENGLYLDSRPEFVRDPLYHAGAYYPQEASSMVIGEIIKRLKVQADSLCLDLCGAPGGKSINMLQALPSSAFLIANEVIRSRVRILDENLRKWGAYNVGIASIHPKEWSKAEQLFDLILVDAPCSGEGMFRKQEGKAIAEWSTENVKFCAERQESILKDIIPCIKKGGYLIYSTCTYSEAENGEMIEKLLEWGLEPKAFSWPSSYGFSRISGHENAYQAYPHKVRGEGLFFSVFRRSGPRETPSDSCVGEEVSAPIPMLVPAGFSLIRSENRYFIENKIHQNAFERVKQLNGTFVGHLPLGEVKGKDFIPSAELAMTDLLIDPEMAVLNKEEAIRYLKKETFALEGKEDGWYLALYETVALGWIKIAAGKMKNHFPKAWMIRKRW